MSGNVTAIIPVRGGSRGIPRKNARILHGKPLLAYSVEAALAAGVISKVFVSTDDAELAEVARRYGAAVLKRSKELAADHVGLDDVIVDAVRTLESHGERTDWIVTIQATCPLLRPTTIAAAVRKCIDEAFDTVLTVTNDTHLNWGLDDKGRPYPLYTSRLNRQYLPPIFRETGGIVVSKRSVLNGGSRFGKRVGVVELSKTEALDIDDRFDWWLAEKSLGRRKVCFHVIGNVKDGVGHVHRALTLADRLIDHELVFVVNEEADIARRIIEDRFYPLRLARKGDEVCTIIGEQSDLVINDILDTTEDYMSGLRAGGCGAIINFEDLGPGCRQADFVINEMYGEDSIADPKKSLHGASCCCLRDEFYSVSPISIRHRVRNVLLLFGGTDPNNLTMKCLKWADAVEGAWAITVVAGIGYGHLNQLKGYAERSFHPVRIVTDSKIVSRYMAETDLAVSSAGRTVFELGSLGIPTIVIAQNARECTHAFAGASAGIAYLGPADLLDSRKFQETFSELVSGYELRRKMHDALLAADIRSGVGRVLTLIQDLLNTAPRFATSLESEPMLREMQAHGEKVSSNR